MKRILLLFLSAIIVFGAKTIAQTSLNKYDIKSGIITYESIMKMGDFEIKEKVVVYFDSYGMKECKETYEDGQLKESTFSDGKELYLVQHNEKTAYKRGNAYRGTELRVEWSEFGTEEDRQAGKYKKLPAMSVAGKNCDMFEYNDGTGNITKYGGWAKIMLYMEMNTQSMQSIQRALKVEENVEVPPDKFTVPAGYSVQ